MTEQTAPRSAITDVLPIHTSDSATFKRCRRRWDWQSPNRWNLRPRVSYQGLSFPLSFGTAVHSALEHHYKLAALHAGNLAVDPEGTKYIDEHGRLTASEKFLEVWLDIEDTARQLNESWWVDNAEECSKHRDLGVGMMKYYENWAKEHDDFEVVSTEHLFSVDTGLSALDTTTGEVKRVHYRGRMDMVVRDKRTGKYGILDHKTTSSANLEDYLAKLDMDEQVTRYVWAAQLEAQQQGLPYEKIDFVYYNVLFKGYPTPPSLTTRAVGTTTDETGEVPVYAPSLAKTTEFTTPELFAEYIKSDPALIEWFKANTKAQDYYEWLKEQGESRFVHREVVYRNQQEITHCGERVKMEILDMLAPDLRIYPNPTSDWYCIKCPFREPCLATMDGSDVDYLLEELYEPAMTPQGEYTR